MILCGDWRGPLTRPPAIIRCRSCGQERESYAAAEACEGTHYVAYSMAGSDLRSWIYQPLSSRARARVGTSPRWGGGEGTLGESDA